MKNKILITGVAGFIGFHASKRFLDEGFDVLGIDNINNYYDQNLKLDRLKTLEEYRNENSKKWEFIKGDIANSKFINLIFKNFKPNLVLNLAAQAGVRYSLKNPRSYIRSNIVGFSNILEGCRKFEVESLIYASSSSVYGGSKNIPFRENNHARYPISLYAATKSSNELMAHSYSHLYQIPCTGLRFFTVYGPYGRPDMAPMIFAKAISGREPITIFNHGKMKRDFTYIDDIVEGIFLCSSKKPSGNYTADKKLPLGENAPHKIFNIGNGNSIKLINFIELLESELGIKAIRNFAPLQPGDVIETFSSTESLREWTGFRPKTSLKDGIKIFAKWYKDYYL